MIFRNLLILLVFLAFTPSAWAESKPWILSWSANHEKWENYKHFNPYLENGRDPHPTQWAQKDWYVEDWLSQRRSGLELVQGFYNVKILKDQEMEDGVPVLVVGPEFYRLSGFDKRRVVQTVDAVYGVTKSDPNQVVILKDWVTRRPIGLFTEYGLQLH